MNSEIISGKLLIISVLFSFLILIIVLLNSKLTQQARMIVCNSENIVTTVIRVKNYDILINPIGDDQTLDCLGKILPFYDRTIDIVVTQDERIVKKIDTYYIVKKILNRATIKTKMTDVALMKNQITIKNADEIFIVNQRPLLSLLKIQHYPDTKMNIVRPISEEAVENLLIKLSANQKILEEDEVYNVFLSGF